MAIENEKILGWAADYTGTPTGKGMKNSIFDGVIRYVGDFKSRPKCIDPREYQDLSNNGIGIALVHENAADDYKGGLDGGLTDAKYARYWANIIGYPSTRPIYFTVDTQLLTNADFTVLDSYFKGILEWINPKYVGGYGQFKVIEYLKQHNLASYFWQTLAWSRKPDRSGEYQLSEHNNLLQILGTVVIDGVTMDRNEILKEDWGQHNYVGTKPTEPVKPELKERELYVLRVDGKSLVLTDGFVRRNLTNSEREFWVQENGVTEINLTKTPERYDEIVPTLVPFSQSID